jgi:hypothetical protein
MFLLQLPRAVLGCFPFSAEQSACLQQLDTANRICIELGITRDDLIRAMPPKPIPFSADHNRWQYVRGSSEARLTDAEAIREALSPR